MIGEGIRMAFGNSMQANNQFKRYPAVRVLVEDLTNGVWNDEEKTLATRYGNIKRIRICGVAIRKTEKEDEANEETSFLGDSVQSNYGVRIQDYILRQSTVIW